MGIHSLFHRAQAWLLAEVVCLELTEVIVGVCMVESEDQVDEGLAAASQQPLLKHWCRKIGATTGPLLGWPVQKRDRVKLGRVLPELRTECAERDVCP